MGLAKGHNKALQGFIKQTGVLTANLGTGLVYSVLEMVKAFVEASWRHVKHKMVQRRSGEGAQCYADPAHALVTQDWIAKFVIDGICADAWRRHSKNSNGYGSEDL